MKKTLIVLIAFITCNFFAQDLLNSDGVVYGFSEYGDLIIYDDASTSRLAPTAAGCRCYQGYDPASNQQSQLYGSCCWKPITTSYPICGGGCVK
ncbi:hypothetical protein NHF50_08470 [Flavobacterium sp. NRK F10]|uniref:hypothetical protein n=1 Tax=Flavobacterium sp. NRK F10 TaxID=2954931 RepID=UPI0020915F03|nr:hypothetical protein [Flavobacterium sp. NRK F10]MCO6175080.1 hypothetical protein [Flavobacterium sp. NRK F10]